MNIPYLLWLVGNNLVWVSVTARHRFSFLSLFFGSPPGRQKSIHAWRFVILDLFFNGHFDAAFFLLGRSKGDPISAMANWDF